MGSLRRQSYTLGSRLFDHRKGDDRRTGRHRDVLPAVESVSHRGGFPQRCWSGSARAGRRTRHRPRPTRRCRRQKRSGRQRWPACRPTRCPCRSVAPPIAPRRFRCRAREGPSAASPPPRCGWIRCRTSCRPSTSRGSRVHRALFERLHVVQAGGRAERRREPVGGAFHGRAHRDALGGGHLAGRQHRPAIVTDARGPRQLLHEGGGLQQVAAGPIQDVEEAVAVRVQQQAARLAAPRRVHQDRRLLRVPIPDVVRRVLEVPLETARRGIERQNRIRVQVVALPLAPVVVGTRDCRSASTACRARRRRCR